MDGNRQNDFRSLLKIRMKGIVFVKQYRNIDCLENKFQPTSLYDKFTKRMNPLVFRNVQNLIGTQKPKAKATQ